MHGTTSTSRLLKTCCSAALFSALFVAVMAVAQPADNRDNNESEEPQRDTATADTADRGSDETAVDNGGVVLSPFDYEASESISEDASVSFPVDI